MFYRSLYELSREAFSLLFCVTVRARIGYAMEASSPNRITEINHLVMVQHLTSLVLRFIRDR